ncbi:hypothetical protein DEA8626_03427 [Defluviimonas aquaemixtae]|uniref:Uncharacterized protein n=1 Tax=Albidovulum aquaemixtae TaxID=1542388 RepID=A0A2R8BLW8_9RHOB|nr:hypothetical protein DEA8626_03427 [Defluviimonas aquaemixtae]
MIRRKARDIERFAGMDRFMAKLHRRGFQAAENSGQIVICLATARPCAYGPNSSSRVSLICTRRALDQSGV